MAEKHMTPEQLEAKRAREERIVVQMIQIYCHGNHRSDEERRAQRDPAGEGLCPDCARLADYVRGRLDYCPRLETKTFCSSCPIHCYRPTEREQITAVMRYAGPRMMLHHPIAALHHAWDTAQAGRRARRQDAQKRA
jgi:hypothetical protein